jgi:glycosyltransferase involved in cell wall biosynthesis
MRILYVSAHFPPDLGALATRVRELTREWARLGHEVHVLTGLPHHPEGVVPEAYRRTLLRHELVDGVHVHRAFLYAARNKGIARRSASFASFGVSAVLAGMTVPRPDVIIATSPQFFTAVAGAIVSDIRDVPLIVEIRDLWPRSIWEVGALPREHVAIRVLERLEQWLYERADRLVSVSQSFRPYLAERGGLRAADEVEFVPNGVTLTRFPPDVDSRALHAELGLDDRPVVAYAGTIGLAHGIEVVLDAARLVPDVQVVLIGAGAERQKIEQAAEPIENLTIGPAVPSHRMPEVYGLADILLVPLRDLPLFETVLPSKMFEIMAMQRPLILGARGEPARLIERAGSGLVVPPEDSDALAAAIRQLVDDPTLREKMGLAGRTFVEDHFDRSKLALEYIAIMENLLATQNT